MNYRIKGNSSVLLMSVRPGAPNADRVEEDGRVLIYEGHDQPLARGGPDPRTVDQPFRTPVGSLTANGKFYEAARRYQRETQRRNGFASTRRCEPVSGSTTACSYYWTPGLSKPTVVSSSGFALRSIPMPRLSTPLNRTSSKTG
jgi:hypothetical protein